MNPAIWCSLQGAKRAKPGNQVSMHKQDQGAAGSAEHCIATALLPSSELKQMIIASALRGSLAGGKQPYW